MDAHSFCFPGSTVVTYIQLNKILAFESSSPSFLISSYSTEDLTEMDPAVCLIQLQQSKQEEKTETMTAEKHKTWKTRLES